MSSKLISIIASVFNAQEYLPNYLSYVNSQTFKKFEIIFIDANSGDESVKIIKDFKFRKGISKKLIEERSQIGIYEAWNLGIENSNYDWVMNYNTDDKLFPSSLYIYSEYINKCHNSDVIYSNCLLSDDHNHQNIIDFRQWEDANNIDNLIDGCCVGPFPLLRKSAVIEAGLFNPDYSISGDYEMWCRMNQMGYKFMKIDEFLGTYYFNPKGMSTRNDSKRRQMHETQDFKIRSKYGNRKISAKILRSIKKIARVIIDEFRSLLDTR